MSFNTFNNKDAIEGDKMVLYKDTRAQKEWLMEIEGAQRVLEQRCKGQSD